MAMTPADVGPPKENDMKTFCLFLLFVLWRLVKFIALPFLALALLPIVLLADWAFDLSVSLRKEFNEWKNDHV